MTVWKRGAGIAYSTVTTASLTAALNGIPTGSATIWVMTCICSLPLIRKTTCLSFFCPTSRHDPIGFLYNWFSIQQFLPEANVTKLLLDSPHNAMPYYEYCHNHGITPFIDLNTDRGCPPVYKDDFIINSDGIPVCRKAHTMRRDGTESAKGRTKCKCPEISFADGTATYTCEPPVLTQNVVGRYTLS